MVDTLNVRLLLRASGWEASSPNLGFHYTEMAILLHFWMNEFPAKDVATDIEVDKNTACDVYRLLREVCSTTHLSSPVPVCLYVARKNVATLLPIIQSLVAPGTVIHSD